MTRREVAKSRNLDKIRLGVKQFISSLSIYFNSFLNHFTRTLTAVLLLFQPPFTAFHTPFRCSLPAVYGPLDAQSAVNLSAFNDLVAVHCGRGEHA